MLINKSTYEASLVTEAVTSEGIKEKARTRDLLYRESGENRLTKRQQHAVQNVFRFVNKRRDFNEWLRFAEWLGEMVAIKCSLMANSN